MQKNIKAKIVDKVDYLDKIFVPISEEDDSDDDDADFSELDMEEQVQIQGFEQYADFPNKLIHLHLIQKRKPYILI